MRIKINLFLDLFSYGSNSINVILSFKYSEKATIYNTIIFGISQIYHELATERRTMELIKYNKSEVIHICKLECIPIELHHLNKYEPQN